MTSVRMYFLLVLLLISSGLRADQETLELYVVHYPPYEIINPDGSISGIDVDVAKAAFAEVGINVVVKTEPWNRILKNIEYGRIAGSITCSKRAGREVYVDYSDPISEVNQVAFSAKERNIDSLRKFQQMQDYSVTVVDGWGIQKELIHADIHHFPTKNVSSGINAILYRNVDIFYNAYLTTMYEAHQLGLYDKIEATFFEDRAGTKFHLCLSKTYPGIDGYIDRFNKGLQRVKEKGIYHEIYQRYLQTEPAGR